MLWTILMVLLTPLSIFALPIWGRSANWGYGPSGALTLVALVLVVLVLTGRL